MRAATYARVSTERQERQQTIDSQLAALRAWAEEAGHELTAEHVFRDEGYSGARLDRPGLDALRDAVRDAEVDIVAVLSPDRLARRYAYQVLILEEFRRAGCEVMFLNHSRNESCRVGSHGPDAPSRHTQRAHGELLRHAQDRARPPHQLPDPGGGRPGGRSSVRG